MSAIPGLKKKLRSVRATGKLSKAMKTVSAAKFSRLSAAWKNYSLYAEQFRFLYREAASGEADAVVVMGSNRGFCGGFNNEILNFYRETVTAPKYLIVCGEELEQLFRDEDIAFHAAFTFDDVPRFADTEPLLDHLSALAGNKPEFRVQLIYPEYVNTMTQTPTAELLTLNPKIDSGEDDGYLWLPKREPVAAALYAKGSRSLLYGAILKTALGAQAATLMTMRSAYDTATEYSQELEGEIHRLRQTEVTADVIETSGGKGDKSNG